EHCMRNARALQRDGDHALLGLLDSFSNRCRHFFSFPQTIADAPVLISHHDQGTETQVLSTFDHFSDALDRAHLVFEFYFCRSAIRHSDTSNLFSKISILLLCLPQRLPSRARDRCIHFDRTLPIPRPALGLSLPRPCPLL